MKKATKNHDLKRGVDFIGVNCVFFCHDGKGNLLLNKRSDKCRDEIGRWDPGAGAMEFGENFEEAVRREVREEYCTEILDLKFISVKNNLRKNEKGERTHWVTLMFTALIDPKKVKNGEPEKMDEIAWFAWEDLPSPMHSKFEEYSREVRDYIQTLS